MRASVFAAGSVVLGLLVAGDVARASEGKWTPQQVLELGPDWVKRQGFERPLSDLWDARAQGGLLANAVQLPGCSGSFVSADGLLITNHHCVVGILQEHSTTQANLVDTGYLARTKADEKRANAFRIQVPRSFRDVTKEVEAAIPAGATDLARFRAVEAAQKKIVAACEAQPGTRCTFATFDGGLFYTLTEFTELADVRLVYAPPQWVGNFGGEVDNWMWPRQAGDFSLLRVYQDGKPYQPKYWFPLSKDGVKPGDAVAVLGYPGTSSRARIADEMAFDESVRLPALHSIYGEWIAIAEDESKKDPTAAIAVADDLRRYQNAYKNSAGMVEGLARGQIVQKQRVADEAVKAFGQQRPELGAVSAYGALVALAAERRQSFERDVLLDEAVNGSRGLAWPLRLVRRSVEAQRPDMEREPGYQERDLERLREKNERDQKRFARNLDQRLFVSWVKRALALPPAQRIGAVDQAFAGVQGDAALQQRVASLYAASKVFDLATRKALFEATPEQLKAAKDPLLDLAIALDAEKRALRDRRQAMDGRALKLRPIWRRAVIAQAGKPVAPDANSTLRVTFGHVQGYTQKDGTAAAPQTTLSSLVKKHTGVAPFDVPEPIRRAFAEKRFGRFVDKNLKEVPVDFLADCDTTGGNSGSPTIDSKGRLVGVNFDRVWENVANDFGYNPAVARNVNADVRYLLWLLEEVEKAPGLVQELGAKP
jgi:hypothetical protein